MTTVMRGVEPLRVSRELLSEKVADLLRHRILTGQFSPGSRLVEDDLAAQLGTSRGPLHDAFSLLAREGLVATTRGRGTFVKVPTSEGISKLYDVRTVLESHAVRLAAECADGDKSLRLREIVDRMARAVGEGSLGDYVRLDMELHQSIWDLSGNEYLVQALDHLIRPCAALIRLNAERNRDWTPTVERHRTLVQAISAGDVEKANRILLKHMENSLGQALYAVPVRFDENQ